MNKTMNFEYIVTKSTKLNIGKTNIGAVLRKKQKTAGEFIWKYLEE